MPIELRILSGARAGQIVTLEQPVIAIGRDASSDLRFDPHADLDVSTKHAEVRRSGPGWVLHDQQSRNGTYVNGERVSSLRQLHDGDVVAFGAQGPAVAVHIPGERAAREAKTQPVPTPPIGGAAITGPRPRRPTAERVAIAVREQTRSLKLGMAAIVIALLVVLVGGWWYGDRQARVRDERIHDLIALNEESAREFQARLQGMNDTALTNDLRRREDSLMREVRASGMNPDASMSAALRRNHEMQRAFVAMDLPTVRQANDDAIVLIATELDGQSFEASGFCVRKTGLIVTNKHVVTDSTATATRISVKFADTREWLPAKIVRFASGDVDLTLLQVERQGTYPVVAGIASDVDVPVGGAIATLGFPLGTDTPMEGSGYDAMAKTSLTTGTVSKSIPDLLQIDAFAGHGSSGSPVFDAHSHVIGVVWGGPKGGEGRIVYAVPADRVKEMVGGQ